MPSTPSRRTKPRGHPPRRRAGRFLRTRRPPRRRRRRPRKRLLMTFLTGLGALAALAALLPLAAWTAGRRRAAAVRTSLGLPPPVRRTGARPLAAAGAVALLGIAAAQPALTREPRVHERTDVQALFVFDISRSMAASA